VSEEISVADELGPRLDAGRDSVIDSVVRRKIARGDPESFDRQADYGVFISRGLAVRENPEKLIEREEQCVQRLFSGHNSRLADDLRSVLDDCDGRAAEPDSARSPHRAAPATNAATI
jgi:hypothetical protein